MIKLQPTKELYCISNVTKLLSKTTLLRGLFSFQVPKATNNRHIDVTKKFYQPLFNFMIILFSYKLISAIKIIGWFAFSALNSPFVREMRSWLYCFVATCRVYLIVSCMFSLLNIVGAECRVHKITGSLFGAGVHFREVGRNSRFM